MRNFLWILYTKNYWKRLFYHSYWKYKKGDIFETQWSLDRYLVSKWVICACCMKHQFRVHCLFVNNEPFELPCSFVSCDILFQSGGPATENLLFPKHARHMCIAVGASFRVLVAARLWLIWWLNLMTLCSRASWRTIDTCFVTCCLTVMTACTALGLDVMIVRSPLGVTTEETFFHRHLFRHVY